jgi:hypothetical protein
MAEVSHAKFQPQIDEFAHLPSQAEQIELLADLCVEVAFEDNIDLARVFVMIAEHLNHPLAAYVEAWKPE